MYNCLPHQQRFVYYCANASENSALSTPVLERLSGNGRKPEKYGRIPEIPVSFKNQFATLSAEVYQSQRSGTIYFFCSVFMLMKSPGWPKKRREQKGRRKNHFSSPKALPRRKALCLSRGKVRVRLAK